MLAALAGEEVIFEQHMWQPDGSMLPVEVTYIPQRGDSKKVNDIHGHAVGDEVLRTVAKILTDQVRESDIVSRWGGEEFVILAPETPLEEARRLSERLRKTLELCQHPEVGQVTASFGVAELASEETENAFINHADQALYAAKAAGRNRVECYNG